MLLPNPDRGQYYPRMYRFGRIILSDEDQKALTATARSVHLLLRDLDELFEVVEPHAANAAAFGLKMRKLLILACTELEALWRAVLEANLYPLGERLTTEDYVKLRLPMRLSDYEIGLVDYPDYPKVAPFRVWSEAKPTASLPWYDAYNLVKHDKERNLNLASLGNCIAASAAVFIIAVAQFGDRHFVTRSQYPQRTFGLRRVPIFQPEEQYEAEGLEDRELTRASFPFPVSKSCAV
jgi:hypothetical protein